MIQYNFCCQIVLIVCVGGIICFSAKSIIHLLKRHRWTILHLFFYALAKIPFLWADTFNSFLNTVIIINYTQFLFSIKKLYGPHTHNLVFKKLLFSSQTFFLLSLFFKTFREFRFFSSALKVLTLSLRWQLTGGLIWVPTPSSIQQFSYIQPTLHNTVYLISVQLIGQTG